MDAVDNAAGSGIVFFTSPMDLLEESHGEGHAEDLQESKTQVGLGRKPLGSKHIRSLDPTDLHDEDAHPGRPENVLVVVKPRLDLFVASLKNMFLKMKGASQAQPTPPIA